MTGTDGAALSLSNGPGPDPAVILTARGAGALATFLAMAVLSVLTGSLGLVALMSALGVVLLAAPGIAWWRAHQALGPPSVHVRLRALPGAVAIGDSCTIDVVVAGAAGRHLPPLAIERPDERWRLTHRLPAAGPPETGPGPPVGGTWWRGRRLVAPTPAALLLLPTGQRGAGAGTGQLGPPVWTGRRGVLRLPGLGVWTHDPFGLFAVAVAVTPPVVVVVHPRPLPQHAGQPAPAAGPSHTAGALVPAPSSSAAGWGDFSDLRPYVAGDRLNLIDWPALARYDRLLVRRFDPETGAAVRLVLDDRAGVHRRADFERLLGALLGMVDEAVVEGRPVEVSTLSGRTYPVPPTPEGLAAFLAVTATFVPRRPAAGPVRRLGGGALITTVTGAERLSPGSTEDQVMVVA